MTEVERIKEQLRRSVEGEAWHGPSLREVLADVTAEEATARPIVGVHTIEEIARHISYWFVATRRRIGGALVIPTEAEQWPDAAIPWPQQRAHLETSYGELMEAIGRFTDDKLTIPIAGKPYDVYFQLHGLTQHNTYHAGQIALLKRAIRASRTGL
jgi:uncharacterized damage-inducible protein DinB